MVRNPPIRSAIQPQICCAKTPAPSCSDSIAAPARAPTPMLPQKATMCASGIDMVTQQQKIAAARIASTRFGGRPATGRGSSRCDGGGRNVGVGRAAIEHAGQDRHGDGYQDTVKHHRSAPAIAVDADLQDTGHTAPATYCPDETNATAEPRRRSNHRVT